MIPEQIGRDHLLEAIETIRRTGVPKARASTRYVLVHGNRHYPPKYVISIASRLATGRELEPSEFSGGMESNSFLGSFGFKVVELRTRRVAPGGVQGSGRKRRKSHGGHPERCTRCKNTIYELLRRCYGQLYFEDDLGVSARLEDHEGTTAYPHLKKVFDELVTYRGHDVFVRTRSLPHADIVVRSGPFVVELDESQHFSEARAISLRNYPSDLRLGYDVQHWIERCESTNAKDNSPVYRDEQRAWYDSLRDFLPLLKQGYGPTVRIMLGENEWCSLDPDSADDKDRFLHLVGLTASSKPEPSTSVTSQLRSYVIGRVVIRTNRQWSPTIAQSRSVINEVLDRWPDGLKVRYLLFSGGFVRFPWPKLGISVEDHTEPSARSLARLRSLGEHQATKVFDAKLLRHLSKVCSYVSFGVDSKDARARDHVELVCVKETVGSRTCWTGKFYPTGGQIETLVRHNQLDSHFIELDGDRLMVLGCHDLNVFSPRAKANSKGWRAQLIKDFMAKAKKFRPTTVLQHPHTADSDRTWELGWGGVRSALPGVATYAGAGTYYFPDGAQRSPLERVLAKTKQGSVLDIVIER